MSYPMDKVQSEADFQKLAQTVATSIQKILQNVSSLQRMVNQFGTAQDSPELKRQLHQIQNYTQQLVKDTDNLLKDLSNCKDRHLKIQHERLLDEFTSALTAFQTVQRKIVDIEKNMIRQQRANAKITIKPPPKSNNGFSESSNAMLFEDSFTENRGGKQTQMQIHEEIDLQALEEQERAIRELEQNIVDVNEIYKKLGSMVYEQGIVVNSIESAVENTSVLVSSGTKNLSEASKYQNKSRKKKLYLALILAIIVIVIILIFSFN